MFTLPRELLCCLDNLFFPNLAVGSCRKWTGLWFVWVEAERALCSRCWFPGPTVYWLTGEHGFRNRHSSRTGNRVRKRDPSYSHHSKQQPETSIVLRSTSNGSCVSDVALWHRLLTYNRSQSVCAVTLPPTQPLLLGEANRDSGWTGRGKALGESRISS